MSERDKLAVAILMTMKQDQISLRQFAEQIGTAHAHLSKVLNRKIDAHFETWARMAKGLNTTIAELLAIPDELLTDFERSRRINLLLPRKPRGYAKKPKAKSA